MNPSLRLNPIIEAAFPGKADKELLVTYDNGTIAIEDKVTASLVRLAATDGVTFEKPEVDGAVVLKPGVWTFKISDGYIDNVQPAPKAEASAEVKVEAKPRKTGTNTSATTPFRKPD